jgi:predicted RNA polymerase sigma factor
MRLTALLLEHPFGATPATYALAARMCLDVARLPARVDPSGSLISLLDHDRSQRDQQLIAEGSRFLALSASGSDLTQYHIEAAIASVHACSGCTDDTDWEAIASLYDTLMSLCPSPIVALNRAIAIAQIAELHYIFFCWIGRTSPEPPTSKIGQPLEISTAERGPWLRSG